jgi:hypothetical protein
MKKKLGGRQARRGEVNAPRGEVKATDLLLLILVALGDLQIVLMLFNSTRRQGEFEAGR